MKLHFQPYYTFGFQNYLYLSFIMCHMEKCFLRSFQFCCKIIHFMSLGLRYWEGATNLLLLLFAAATSMEEQVSSSPGWRVLGCLCSPHKCSFELWSSCCCIISIYAVLFSSVTTGPWSRRNHSDSPFSSLCPSFPHGSPCLICLFNLTEAQARHSSGTMHSDTKLFPAW